MKLAALAFVTTLGLGGVVQADPAAPPPPPPRGQLHQLLLERFDRDHDGRLDPKERRRAIRTLRRLAHRMAMRERHAEQQGARRPGRVERLDRNGDGAISPDEMRPGMARRLQRFDRNGDGVISPDEMPPGKARRLRPLDRNGDGSLDDRDR